MERKKKNLIQTYCTNKYVVVIGIAFHSAIQIPGFYISNQQSSGEAKQRQKVYEVTEERCEKREHKSSNSAFSNWNP